jgi:hypothetical protein
MSSIKRFENRAQLVRHIHQETGKPIDELWEKLEQELNQ